MNIFALWGEIEVNRRQAETDIKAVEKQAEKSGREMESSFNKVTTVVGTVIKEVGRFGKKVVTVGKEVTKQAGIPLAAMTALAGGLAKTTADYGDQMAKNAQEVGLGVEAYQELTYAMGQNNLSQEDSLRVLGRLNQRVGLARSGNENYRKSLKKMGVDLEALDKGLIGTEEAFGHILEYLSEMPDSQMQAAYASEVFGTQLSRRMMPMIRAGAEGIAELRDRAHELGIVMDEEATRRAEQFGDTMSDLKGTMGGFNRSIGKELFAPFMNIANWMMEIISAGTEWVKENPKLVRQIIIWGGAIAGVLGVLVTLGTVLIVTGKIIGALGAVFNILTSKPLLIIAAIGLLWLAWENDWGKIRTTTEKVWAVIEPIFTAIWDWLQKSWEWTINIAQDIWDWLFNTTWAEKIEDIKGWFETAWEWGLELAKDGWEWVKNSKLYNELIRIKNLITNTKAWQWTMDVAVPAIVEGGKMVIEAIVEATGKMYNAIKKGFETGDWSDALDIGADLWRKGVVLALGLKLLAGAGAGILSAIGGIFGNAAGALGAGGLPLAIGLLSVGIQLAEAFGAGNFEKFAKNVLVAALTGAIGGAMFGPGGALMGFNLAINLKLGEKLETAGDTIGETLGVPKGHFQLLREYEAERKKAIDEATKDLNAIQKLFWQMGNKGGVPAGFPSFEEWKQGAQNVALAFGEGLKSGKDDVVKATDEVAQEVADRLIGQSPPPKGPLKDLTVGARAAMAGWAAGISDGLDETAKEVETPLEKLKGLFNSIWDKVPEEIKEPIEQAMDWVGGLIEQAENALFKLDEFEEELARIMGGGTSPEDEAQGFMNRLAKALDEKLKALDDPLTRFVDAVTSAGLHLVEVVRLLGAGDWKKALLSILMETESFALAMELLGAILDPVITLFDNVFRPVIEFIVGLWNSIMKGLAGISIFGWRPFKGLEDKIIDTDPKKGGSGDGGGRGGRQVSEITGPTRDLLVDLLTPLASFGQIVAPIQAIHNILDTRLPDFNNMEFGVATAGAGGMGSIVFEPGSIVISSSATDSRELSRNMLDEIEREMARRIGLGVRGRGGR